MTPPPKKPRPSLGMTIEQYADHRRVTTDQVQAALAAGQITTTIDGTIDPGHPPIGLSQAQYARHRKAHDLRGGTRQMVSKAAKLGWLVHFVDGTINSDASDERWARVSTAQADTKLARDTTKAPPPHVDPDRLPMTDTTDDPDYLLARARRETANAEKARMEADIMAGKLVYASDVERQWSRITHAIRQSMLGLPDRLSGDLAGLREVRQIHDLLDAEIRQSLQAAAEAVDATTERQANE